MLTQAQWVDRARKVHDLALSPEAIARYIAESKRRGKMKLYYHKTSGGAEYLTDTYTEYEYHGALRREGIFTDKTKYIVRIDGDITKDAELDVRQIRKEAGNG